MACDYQIRTYVKRRGNGQKRTSYGQMTHWLSQTQPDVLNPYHTARQDGLFRRVDPVLRDPVVRGGRATRREAPRSEQDAAYLRRAERTGKLTEAPPPPTAPPSGQYHKSGGYDDFHKAFLQLQKQGISPTYPTYGPPRLRNGRVGASWRHVKEVMQARGQRTLFVDGEPRCLDNSRLLSGEVPGGNSLQPLAGSYDDHQGEYLPERKMKNPPTAWTAHDKEAFRASEAGNWLVMR